MSTYYVTRAAPGTGIGTIGDPYTLSQARTAVIAGDKVFVKADADYDQLMDVNEILQITVLGTMAAPITYEGYTTTPGDGGRAVFNQVTNTAAYGIDSVLGDHYHIFKNFRITGGNTGVNLNAGAGDYIRFYNCRIDNQSSYGIRADRGMMFMACEIDNNSAASYIINVGVFSHMMGCKVHNNNSHCFGAATGPASCTVTNTAFYDNTGTSKRLIQLGDSSCSGNTIDGDGATTPVAFYGNGAFGSGVTLYNNIFMNLNIPFEYGGNSGTGVDSDGQHAIGYNVLYNVTSTADYNGAVNDVITVTDPVEDAAGLDYTPASGSEAIDAGLDASVVI